MYLHIIGEMFVQAVKKQILQLQPHSNLLLEPPDKITSSYFNYRSILELLQKQLRFDIWSAVMWHLLLVCHYSSMNSFNRTEAVESALPI